MIYHLSSTTLVKLHPLAVPKEHGHLNVQIQAVESPLQRFPCVNLHRTGRRRYEFMENSPDGCATVMWYRQSPSSLVSVPDRWGIRPPSDQATTLRRRMAPIVQISCCGVKLDLKLVSNRRMVRGSAYSGSLLAGFYGRPIGGARINLKTLSGYFRAYRAKR